MKKLDEHKNNRGKRNLEPSEIQETEKSKEEKYKKLACWWGMQFYQNHTFLFLLSFSSYLILGYQVLGVSEIK